MKTMSHDEFVAYIRRSVVHSKDLYCGSYVLIIFFIVIVIIIGKAVVSQEVLHHTGV